MSSGYAYYRPAAGTTEGLAAGEYLNGQNSFDAALSDTIKAQPLLALYSRRHRSS
jgi:hypothetical protein